MNEPGRLLFVVNDCDFFLSHRAPIGIAAVRAGFDVHLAALDDGHGREVERNGIRFHPLPIDRHAVNPVADLRLLFALLRLFRRVQPDIIHSVTVKPVLYGGIAARLLGVPAVVFAISGTGYLFEEANFGRTALRAALAPLFRFSLGHTNSHVIFQNNSDFHRFTRSGFVHAEQAEVIAGSGVDLAQFKPVPEPPGVPVALFAGRLLWAKGVGVFAAAARILSQQGIAMRCVICGMPPSHNRDSVPVAQIQEWVRAGDVEWWGHRKDMAEVLASVHVVCLPSHYGEGLPKILIESAAMGHAVVTTDWPGCRDAIEDGVTGFCVPIKSPEAVAERLALLACDPDLRATMGAAARRRAEALFDVDNVSRRTLTIYDQLTDPSGS